MSFTDDYFITRKEFRRELERLEGIMEASQAQNQASIDAETTAVDAILTQLQTVQSEVDALKAALPNIDLDFTNLDAAIAAVGSQVQTDVTDAAPATPAPTPDPAPASSSTPATEPVAAPPVDPRTA